MNKLIALIAAALMLGAMVVTGADAGTIYTDPPPFDAHGWQTTVIWPTIEPYADWVTTLDVFSRDGG